MSDWSEGPNVREEVADAVAWGKKIERERIIALLEAEETVHETGEGELRDIITLIKGEN